MPKKYGKKNISFGVYTPNLEITLKPLQEKLGTHIPFILIFTPWKVLWKKEMDPFPLKLCKLISKNKSIPFIKWEPATWARPHKPLKGRKPKTFNKMINDHPLEKIAKGNFDLYIKEWAKAAKKFKKEIWLSFGHEMNGYWYHWAKRPKLYKKALSRIYKIFKKLKAKNVRWVFCVNNYPLNYEKYCPKEIKNDKKTIIAIDGYNAEGVWNLKWKPFKYTFNKPYKYALKQFPGKKIIIGETGCAEKGGPARRSPAKDGGEGGNKSAWIKDAFSSLNKEFPKISIVIWFNINKEADWRINSSKESLEAFKAQI